MPIYSENFDELTQGITLPAGWSAPNPGVWGVTTPNAPFDPISSPNVLERTLGGTNEGILSPDSTTGPDVTCAFFTDGTAYQEFGCVLYGSNTGSSLSGYVGSVTVNGIYSVIAIKKFVSGSPTTLWSTSASVQIDSDAWYWIKLGYDTASHTIYVTVWQDGAGVIGGDSGEVVDSTYTSGASGLFNNGFTKYYDSFSVDLHTPGSSGPTNTPTISSGGVSPTSGIVGTVVTITGTNFGTDASQAKVSFNGVQAAIASITSTQIVCSVPDGATTGPLNVNTMAGGAASPPTFTVLPNISSFSPISGPVGTSVTINGTNFSAIVSGDIVQFNGTTATVTQASYHTLTATITSGSTTGKISVTTGDGKATSVGIFTVGTNVAPTITSFTPISGPVGTSVTIVGTGFVAGAANNTILFSTGAAAAVSSATSTQIIALVPTVAVTGPITVTNANGSATSPSSFTVTTGVGVTLPPDTFDCTVPDDGPLSCDGLAPYLRAILKDTADDLAQLGVQAPIWNDASLCRYLELARGEYSRHRGKRATVLTATVAQQQFYPNPDGCLGGRVEDVLWAPAGFDLDQISAMAAALAAGPGLLWGGGVPVVGRVYFDSPASIRVWSIIREAWQETFGGHWRPAQGGYNLVPVPADDGLKILVRYRTEALWADIPWEHRLFILGRAELFAIESLTLQTVAQATATGTKLSLGMRALVQLIQQKTLSTLDIREPGVMAGRS
ncbi:MAG TPA: IPT/TIG domain-containing protein [Armatimonadota bacterium]|nr:IPT/TIG domain-containing protein [Armatimonadota bacterium]